MQFQNPASIDTAELAAQTAQAIVTNPPTVGVQGATNGAATAGPNFASRSVDASATVVASGSILNRNQTLNFTIITAGSYALELHYLSSMQMSAQASVGTSTPVTIHLKRSDTMTDIIAPSAPWTPASDGDVSPTYSKDFQGVTLPRGVNVVMQLVSGGAGGGMLYRVTGTVDLNYCAV